MFQYSLLLIFMLFYVSANTKSRQMESSIYKRLIVNECPDMPLMKNVTKNKLLGFWYAYATTPLPFSRYQRRCASYNVRNSTYFQTNILYTNHDSLTITYACNYIPEKQAHQLKLRMLTRTRTPMPSTINEALNFLKSVKFPIETLDWLKSEAFCFEWYQLKFETDKRPKDFQAPFNRPGD